VSLDDAQRVLGSADPFPYYYKGHWQAGYYDETSNIFIGVHNNVARTVIRPGPGYIESLMKAGP
jgi:hypothetical protein